MSACTSSLPALRSTQPSIHPLLSGATPDCDQAHIFIPVEQDAVLLWSRHHIEHAEMDNVLCFRRRGMGKLRVPHVNPTGAVRSDPSCSRSVATDPLVLAYKQMLPSASFALFRGDDTNTRAPAVVLVHHQDC